MSQIPRDDAGAYVDEAAKRVGLPIRPEHRAGVIQYVSGLLASAELILEFSLPEEVETAPVFDP